MAVKITFDDVAMIQAIPGKSVNDFTSKEMESAKVWELKFWEELREKSPFYRARHGDWRADDETPLPIITVTGTKEDMKKGEYQNNDTGWTIRVSNRVRGETVQHSKKRPQVLIDALGNIDSIIQNAVLLDSITCNAAKSEAQAQRKVNMAFMHSFYNVIEEQATRDQFLVKLFVSECYDDKAESIVRIAYELRGIIRIPLGAQRFTSPEGVHTYAKPSDTELKVSKLFQLVKDNDKAFTPK